MAVLSLTTWKILVPNFHELAPLANSQGGSVSVNINSEHEYLPKLYAFPDKYD